MGDWLKKVAKTISEKGGIFMFLRAQFSSQLASITDFSVTIVLAKVFSLYYVYATFLGSVCGGIVNCIINYKWTFKAQDSKKRHVAIKYLTVWTGSIIFNTSGTYLVTELLGRFTWLRDLLGHLFDDVFIVSKVFVSLIVGFVWNYNMQRLFVYRNRDFKKYFRKKSDMEITEGEGVSPEVEQDGEPEEKETDPVHNDIR
ncbi:putative flippase GtrA [Dysgonomonas sp. PFB1-18]|uniref:GtrA family protein n=1 Tax=unclassified Dysgonomonas TaxID=2630389 RepID=UPI002474E1BD|nr:MULTISPECIES: GtrA family protein [unclassified Dysgonomonas]MDH6307500.1 putative flippase GtrA [Dysgonomonas sp. PF1-14]MDH6337418.1 putative flippase GtrA [Dysgonomonas sp. PF1-16]MDH6379342.1 putative flippase GtrA [Dysgonomonas sp. PFB1-18]MDH6396020.1 putative flippase GtrA [Dysgonomonas sp. PF1-23]